MKHYHFFRAKTTLKAVKIYLNSILSVLFVILAWPESFITPFIPLNLRGMKGGYPDKRE